MSPGTYKALYYRGESNVRPDSPVMSNTPAEILDLVPFVLIARGHVLVIGLGLGVAVQMLIDKPEITRITVLEKDPDIIRLTGNYYRVESTKVHIIQGDAFDYPVYRLTL